MKRNNPASFYTTIFITVPLLLFVCVICIFMSMFIYNQKSQTILADVKNMADYVSTTNDQQLAGMEYMIHSENIQNYLMNQNDSQARTLAGQTIFNAFNSNDTLVESTLVNKNGTIILSSDSSLEGTNVKETELIKELDSGKENYTVLIDRDDIPMLKIAKVIKDDAGNTIGYYERVSPLNYLNTYAKSINSLQGNVYILTSNFTTLIYEADSKNANAVLNSYSGQYGNLSDLASQVSENKEVKSSGLFNFPVNAKSNMGAYKIVDGLGWAAVIGEPLALLYYDINKFQLLVLTVAILMIVLINVIAAKSMKTTFAPLQEYQKNIARSLSGNYSFKCKTDMSGEIGSFGKSINELMSALERERIQNSLLERQLNDIITIDATTGLGCRRAFYDLIDQFFGQDPQEAIILFRLDGYHDITENYGEGLGARILESVAELLKQKSNDYTYIGRLYDDTFGIFVCHYNNEMEVIELVKNLRDDLASITRVDDLQIRIRPYFGIVFYGETLLGRSDWLHYAGMALRGAETTEEAYFIYDFDEEMDDEFLTRDILNNTEDAIYGFTKKQNGDKHTDDV